VIQPASYLLVDEATQSRHTTNKGVPRRVLLGIDIGLDPQAITH
jgi:hypothetical protein